MPKKHEIVYPIFLECCQYSEDAFWENIFEDLAYGKPPYGTYISKGFLTCSYKTKEFTYKIERKDPKILHDDIMELLSKKLGVLSQKEKVKKRLAFNKVEKDIKTSRQDWGSIRKKNVRDTLYEKYVIEMKHKHKLNIKQCKYLLSIIIISIMFKTISTKDIEYEDDRIRNIKGIEFEDGEVILKRPLCSLSSVIAETPDIGEGKKMSENWGKYLKQIRAN